ncbi:hypothetical protein HY967_01285 [Candidatus Jorgensenbacteria bacterium]|nr:hypothetical protein [Candidatus Jorgensenbacteria bacterium]
MKSSTMVVAPIIAALVKSEDILGKDRKWGAVNSLQTLFLKKYFSSKNELSKFSSQELRSWVSLMASELNEILAKEGFDIRLEDFGGGEFGVVSILDVLVEWMTKGTKASIWNNGNYYPGVRMTSDFSVFRSKYHSWPIAAVYTKSGDYVYMTVAGEESDGFNLLERIERIGSGLREDSGYEYVEFPMIDLNHEVDIKWLRGMQTNQVDTWSLYQISQALQQTKFKMNEFGARVKSAVAIGVFLSTVAPPPPKALIIDKPFYLWIERDGVSAPIIAARFDLDVWKDPGSLSM